MRRHIVPLLAAGIAIASVAAAPSQAGRADVDHEVELLIGESATVDGGVPQGVNPSPFVGGSTGSDLTCSKAPNEYCETILVHLTNPYEEENARKGRERANANFELTTGSNMLSDYDVYWYESDADGTKGAQIASSTAFPVDNSGESTEGATLVITSTPDDDEVWVLVEVYYFSALEAYSMAIDFAS